MLRWALIGVGTASLGLGMLGSVLPLLPTTPFLLLSAACFARSSTRFHDWLLRHPLWGEIIREWRAHRRLPPQARRNALIFIPLTFGVSTWCLLERPAIWIPLDLFGVGLWVWLYKWGRPILWPSK